MRMSFLVLLLFVASAHAAIERGFVETPGGYNKALLVSVGHGLSGLDFDIKNVKEMIANPAYEFQFSELHEGQAQVADVKKALTQAAQDARDGTFFFYYTGHGGVGTLWLQDTTIKVEEIRKAIEDGRANSGPLKRLVIIYDSCHAGSMMDPMRLGGFGGIKDETVRNSMVADGLLAEFSKPSRTGAAYWEKLMIIASSRADESSLASSTGSIFTLAMKKAYDEAMKANDTVNKFIELSQKYTEGHHPVARLVPASLGNEKMVP